MSRYIIAGLSVVSDLTLPGLIALDDPAADSDVAIRAGAVPERLDGATGGSLNWQITDGLLLLDIPGIVRMLIGEGREIVYEIAAATDPADAAIFVAGTGFGILLHQRGRIVLHASAVRLNGGAVLFCGASGAGKSTLAAALAERGYDLLSDDICAVSIDAAGLASVESDGRELKLWQNAIDRLQLAGRRGAPVRSRLEKFYVTPRDTARAPMPMPLSALYVLREERGPAKRGIERLNIVDSALNVRANAYRPVMVRRMGQQQAYFEAAATICRQAGVFSLTRRLAFADFPATIAALEAHWRDIGLQSRAA